MLDRQGEKTKGAGENGKSVWNSLEIAKLCVGIATPASIAVLGIWINQQNIDAAAGEARRVRVATTQREAAIRQENQTREDGLRLSTQQREDAIREASIIAESNKLAETLKREEAVRRSAIARELALRSADEIRQDALRLREKRAVFWKEFSAIYSEVFAYRPEKDRAVEALESITLSSASKMKSLMDSSGSYLPRDVRLQGYSVADYAEIYAKALSSPENKPGEASVRKLAAMAELHVAYVFLSATMEPLIS